jgi:hypothetical protein
MIARNKHASMSQLLPFSARLLPFHGLRTNSEIPEFPTTLNDLVAMTDEALSRVLSELNVPVDGSLLDKKRRLMLHIGFRESCACELLEWERVVDEDDEEDDEDE